MKRFALILSIFLLLPLGVLAVQEAKPGEVTKIYSTVTDSAGLPTVSADCVANIINNTGSVIKYAHDLDYLPGTNNTYYFNTSTAWGDTVGGVGMWVYELNCTVGEFQAYAVGNFVFAEVSYFPQIIAFLAASLFFMYYYTRMGKNDKGFKMLFFFMALWFLVLAFQTSYLEAEINSYESLAAITVTGYTALLMVITVLLFFTILFFVFNDVFKKLRYLIGGKE